jgi:hypothetical protein
MSRESTRKYQTINDKLDKLTCLQTKTPSSNVNFYPCVVNNSDITFTRNELSLLSKGLKNNLHLKQNWLQTLALEAENTITYLPTHEQDSIRYSVAHNIRLHKQQQRRHIHNTACAKHEKHIFNSIKEKLTANRAIITKADKGNSLIIYAHDYHQEVTGFIANNSFDIDSHNPTNKF